MRMWIARPLANQPVASTTQGRRYDNGGLLSKRNSHSL
jgi:hypothetical protein